ncbi:helix-turn-helix domain-containing protein [Nocardiopsis kunsanensis]|uniref:HTH araC/xylS-type domain-containing protein n=1 Tax=Nocardiopsis kunsanensis TaxID=141693 RepID=A0A919CEW9_9ACTN|nr:helix-turn-helix domain-containing protein [Nocardiopsis kunsanensis]GHD16914.1 hypothetical protein GCM10007147_05510 [Nocardiopsis kunsanensis]
MLSAGENQARRQVAAGQSEALNACGGRVGPRLPGGAPAGETGTGGRRETHRAYSRKAVGIPEGSPRGGRQAPCTLTRVTLAAAGVGAKEFIDRRVVPEARRPLAHGDEPVSGIAARLGFLDTSNSVKYYTRRTSSTPTVFRNRFRADPSG